VTTPVIIEAALNGVTSRRRNPGVPVTPDELAADAIGCIDRGATVVHTHAANHFAPPAERAAEYAACYRSVLTAHPEAILYPTIGGGASPAEQHAHVAMLASEGLIRASVLDPGSVNLGGTGPDGLPPESDFVYTNTFAATRYAMDLATEHRLGPSVAIYEPGWLQVILAYHRAGALPPGTLVKLYFAGGGYLGGGDALWGAPPIPEALDLYLAMLAGTGIPWAVAVLGGDLFASEIPRLALERGGHLRVGLEDDQTATANVDLVERAVALCAEYGRPVATACEAVNILGLTR
jgi:uncharacterized protein (DUF849 family)